MRLAMDHLVDDILALYHLIRRTSHPIHRAEITPEQYWLLRLLRRKGASQAVLLLLLANAWKKQDL
jgi:hypothetical protein